MNVANPHNLTNRPTSRLSAIWAALLMINVCVVALSCAQTNSQSSTDPASVVTQIDGPDNIAADAVRFEAIDVFVTTGESALAAYQFELQSVSQGVEIVGIEGGEHEAFAAPPYYDPNAMNNNRVILAAFSTAKQLPTGRSRVARIHVQLEGPGAKEYRTKLSVSANSDGQNIPAEIEVVKAKA